MVTGINKFCYLLLFFKLKENPEGCKIWALEQKIPLGKAKTTFLMIIVNQTRQMPGLFFVAKSLIFCYNKEPMNDFKNQP